MDGSGGGVDLRLWGKERGLPRAYPLVCHLLDTAAVAGAVWDGYLAPGFRRFVAEQLGVSEARARALVVFWAGLHDIGKSIAVFQGQSATWRPPDDVYPDAGDTRVRHELATHAWLITRLTELGYSRERVCLLVAQTLGGHHGAFYGTEGKWRVDPLAALPELGGGAWEDQRMALLRAIHRVVGAPAPPTKLKAAGGALVCGIVILADWLASQEDFLLSRLPDLPVSGAPSELAAHYRRSIEVAPGLLEDARLGRLRLRAGDFAEAFGFPPNDMQQSIEERLPGLVGDRGGLLLITVPTGAGKTEAALHAARILGAAAGTPGIFLGLPTMATADKMYERGRDYAEHRADGPTGVTLMHSLSWLADAYRPVTDNGQVLTSDSKLGQRRTDPGDWLRGAKRGLLAPLAVGTIDQVLLSVLPTRHNMLRMLGLTGKVLVIDEVHAYDAYMQGLLRQLLVWAGALGVPVVLLSATLPRPVSRRLVESYLRGARPGVVADMPDPPYPGWLYVDAAAGPAHVQDVAGTPRLLQTDVREVPCDANGGLDRSVVLRDVLASMADERGCVAVIVNTVAEAQRTFRDLKQWFGTVAWGRAGTPDLDLLHARFPAARREQITADVTAKYGKDGERPTHGGVVVATQVLEQSLDLDFDLMISDLAPIALLLQRAGRCHRHVNARPPWLSRPRLVVLTYAGDEPPRAWPFVYPTALLRRTRETLDEWCTEPITVPADVQGLVDRVYDESFAEGNIQADDIERIADDQVKASLADMTRIPAPGEFSELHSLTDRDVNEDMFATRLGADSVRVLCVYDDADGDRWLDTGCSTQLPAPNRRGRFTPDQVRQVMAQTIPVPATWVAGRGADHDVPPAWQDNPYLRKIVLLPHKVGTDATIAPARLGRSTLFLHPEEGLIRS